MSASTESKLYRFERNAVVVASAGTGKTHALVGVILHALLGATNLVGKGKPVDPRRLIATTFSRKAGAEIRVRLVHELEKIAAGAATPYDALLKENHSHHEKIAKEARRTLEQIGRSQIGTLHAFATSIVKAHALELGLPLGLDFEREEDRKQRMVDAIIFATEELNRTHPNDIRLLIDTQNGVDPFVQAASSFLARLEEDGGRASALVVRNDSVQIDAWRDELRDHALFFANEMKMPEAAVVAAGDLSADAIAAFVGKSRASGALREKRARFFEFREEIKRTKSTTNGAAGGDLGALFSMAPRIAEAATVMKMLLASAQERFHSTSRTDSVVGFSDVLRLARNLLRDHPAVAEEVSNDYDALLVDECQDTSRVQSELVQLLWAEDHRTRGRGEIGGFSRVRPKGLFVVGDRKQSIYGFRGADVSIFSEIVVGLAGERAVSALGVPTSAVKIPEKPTADFFSLVVNRRGEPELLSFANVFSQRRFVPENSDALYEIRYAPETEDLESPSGEPKEGVCRTEWIKVGNEKNSDAPWEAKAIALRILEIMKRGEPRRKDGERASFRDVAVLAHTNGMLDAVAYALAEFDIPYVVAGRGFYSSTEVRDLAAMLALVLNPQDATALLTVLRGTWGAVHDETILGLTDGKRGLIRLGSGWDSAPRRSLIRKEDEPSLARMRSVVESLRRNVERLGPGGILRAAVDAFQLEETLILLPRGAQRVANVRKLISLAEKENDPRSFLESLHRRATDDTTESDAATFSEGEDAVRLLTVHASKGLDFPIVFIPELGRPKAGVSRRVAELGIGTANGSNELAIRVIDKNGRSAEPPAYRAIRKEASLREQAERQRLAYVAITRASSHMAMVGFKKAPIESKATEAAASNMDILRKIADDDALRAAAHLSVREMSLAEIEEASKERRASLAIAIEPFRPVMTRVRSLPIAPTSLQDFHHCARRFQLVHLLALPERHAFRKRTKRVASAEDVHAMSPELEGTIAHAVLERVPPEAFGDKAADAIVEQLLAEEGLPKEHASHAPVAERVLRFMRGAYGSRLRDEKAELIRERTFTFSIASDGDVPEVKLRGTIDLIVRWPDGTVDVIDYKRARGPDATIHSFQLDLYTLAVNQAFPEATRIRRGVVFLGGEADEPAWLGEADLKGVAADVANLGGRLTRARISDSFARSPIAVCERIRCGFIERCYGDGSAEANPVSETTT